MGIRFVGALVFLVCGFAASIIVASCGDDDDDDSDNETGEPSCMEEEFCAKYARCQNMGTDSNSFHFDSCMDNLALQQSADCYNAYLNCGCACAANKSCERGPNDLAPPFLTCKSNCLTEHCGMGVFE